jgi:N-terminal half of MaoC dehydratase
MTVDRDRALATDFPPLTVDVERGRLRFFAQSIGQTDPIYLDFEGARAAGHRDLPVPPTFFFSLSLERPGGFQYLADVGVDLRHILHGEQLFDYRTMAYAGDTLVLRERIVDVVSKRGGAMDLIIKQTEVHRQSELIANCQMVIVARQESVTA